MIFGSVLCAMAPSLQIKTISSGSQNALCLLTAPASILQTTPQGYIRFIPYTKGTRSCFTFPPCCHIPKRTNSRYVRARALREPTHHQIVTSVQGKRRYDFIELETVYANIRTELQAPEWERCLQPVHLNFPQASGSTVLADAIPFNKGSEIIVRTRGCV